MNLIYWCPYLSKVATVRAVLNSAISIKQYSKNKLNPQIINSVGEWSEFQNLINNNNIDLINLFNFKNFYKNLPKNSYLKSRISFFLISIITIKSLYKFLKNLIDLIREFKDLKEYSNFGCSNNLFLF